jgi:hypothetical protein
MFTKEWELGYTIGPTQTWKEHLEQNKIVELGRKRLFSWLLNVMGKIYTLIFYLFTKTNNIDYNYSMKRKLILTYSKDLIEKKNKFVKKYNEYKIELNNRNVILTTKINNTRSELFNISLYGYDGKLKYVTNKINCIPFIIKTIDEMPYSKMEKIKSIELYTDSHPKTTIKNTGYKDKKKALNTLKLIKNKPIKQQFLIINVLYQRAKYHKNQTKGMIDAMNVFKKWLNKYKVMKGGVKKLPYLPLSLVNSYEKLANYYNVSRKARGLEKPSTSDEGFLVVYRKVKGNEKLLKDIPCKKDKKNGVHWDRKRTVEILGKLGQAKSMKLDFFHKNGKLKGLPTVIHVNMIMWAYSPVPNKLKKQLFLLQSL